MQADGNKTVFFELADRVLRSWWTLVAGITLGLAGAVLALHYIPKVFEATTKIWITEQQIPKEVVKSTVNADMSRRLLAFRESVLDRPYMLELIKRTYGLPETDEELRILRARIRANVTAVPSRTQDLGLLSFAVTYRDSDPQRAANVVNTLSQLYVEQNAEFREKRADRTAETIQKMSDGAKSEFDEIDSRMTAFVKEHQFETEEYLAVNFKLLESRQKDLELNQTSQATALEQKKQLEDALAQARMGVPPLPTPGTVNEKPSAVAPLTQRIAQAQRELDELRISYSDRHPTYIRKKRELEDLLAVARAQRPDPGDGSDPDPNRIPEDPTVSAYLAQIVEVKRSLATLNDAEAGLRRDIAEYERRINVEPEVQRQLNAMREEHSVAQETYRKLQRDSERAKGSQELEYGQLGQRLEVLEYAAVPSLPVAPRPIAVYILGLFAGVLVFVGPTLVRHLLTPTISSEAGLRSTSPFPVLVTIPRILSHQTQRAARLRTVKNLGFSVISCALFVVCIVFLA